MDVVDMIWESLDLLTMQKAIRSTRLHNMNLSLERRKQNISMTRKLRWSNLNKKLELHPRLKMRQPRWNLVPKWWKMSRSSMMQLETTGLPISAQTWPSLQENTTRSIWWASLNLDVPIDYNTKSGSQLVGAQNGLKSKDECKNDSNWKGEVNSTPDWAPAATLLRNQTKHHSWIAAAAMCEGSHF